MRKSIGLLILMLATLALGAGCARMHPVRRATVGSAKAVGKGTVWVAKKTGQGVVYVTKAGTNAVKSIGKDPVKQDDLDTLVHVGGKPLDDGTADRIEQEVAERESGDFDMSDTRTAEKTASPPQDQKSSSGWSTKGSSSSDVDMMAADDPGDLAFGGSSGSGGSVSSSGGSGEIRYDLPSLDLDAKIAAAEGRSTKK